MITLQHYLVLGAILFSIGLYGATSKKNAIAVFMSIELMLNSVNINLVAFNHFVNHAILTGHTFAIFVIVIATCETSVGLAIILALYRHNKSTTVDDINILKW